MVLSVTRFLSTNLRASPGNRPLITSIPTNYGAGGSRLGGGINYKEFWNRFRNSSELVSVLSIPITDMLGDRPIWTDLDGFELELSEKKKAQKFWRQNRIKESLKGMFFDEFLLGDGYLWKDTTRIIKKLESIKEALIDDPYLVEGLSKLQLKELFVKAVDEDYSKAKVVEHVAASTMKIIHDEVEVLGYEQVVHGNTAKFSTEEIIHFRYLALDGKVKGFAPAEALVAEIMLAYYIKMNMISFMRNGGAPDKVFILPNEIAYSNNYKMLISQLRKYKRIENRHGHLVFTGDLDIKDLQGSPKDMEYKDSSLYVLSNIAFAYGIPVTRIPFLIGSSAAKGDSGGLSESGYWNGISEKQDEAEDLLNEHLFEPLGWKIKFPRRYKQDEVREAQTNSMNADTVTKFQTIFMKNGKRPTIKKLLELTNFNREDIEEFEPLEIDVNGNPLLNQNMLDNQSVMSEKDKLAKNQTKRNVANQKGSKESAVNP